MNTEQTLKRYPFEFTGNGFEYFKIWIVNICLSILTFGIYSAWAKVRTNRYFYGNTKLAGSSFEYLANPVAILVGRAMAVVAISIYSVVAEQSAVAAGIVMIVYAAIFPWAIVQSLMFRAHNTAYRNLRFRFEKNYKQAFITYLLIPGLYMGVIVAIASVMIFAEEWSVLIAIVIALMFFAAIPIFQQITTNFFTVHSGYGSQKFKFRAGINDYIMIYVYAFLITLGAALLLVVFIAVLAAGYGVLSAETMNWDPEALPPWMIGVWIVVAYSMYLLPYAYVRAKMANMVLGHTDLGDFSKYRFHATQDVWELLVIYITNIVLIAVTLGLYIPWAKVRLAKYRALRLCFIAEEDIDSFVATESESVNALGEELGDVLDFDIGF